MPYHVTARALQMYLKLLPLLASAAAFTGCSSSLDSAATAQNVGNVEILTRQNDALLVRTAADPATLAAARQFNASALRLAEAIRDSTR